MNEVVNVEFQIIGMRCKRCCDLMRIRINTTEDLRRALKWHMDHLEDVAFQAVMKGAPFPVEVEFKKVAAAA